MGRINTNVQSMIAQRILSQNNSSLTTSLERLSTGVRVNRGKDDPAGLIVSENLRAEQKALNQALANSERADQVANIAEGGLQEVSNLLIELQSLVNSSASSGAISKEEKDANQLQIDSILQTVDRVANNTNFQGLKLLNGNFDFKVSGIAAGVTDYRVNSAKFNGTSMNVDVQITTSAQQGGLFLSTGGTLNTNSGQSLVLQISGSQGTRELSFSSGTTLQNVVNSVNSFKDITGVEATLSGTGVRLRSVEFGSSEFVSVKVINAAGINDTANGDAATPVRGIYKMTGTDFDVIDAATGVDFVDGNRGVTDAGQDLRATINGVQAVGNGRTTRLTTDVLDVELTLNAASSQTLGPINAGSAFTITGGGATFQLASRVDIAGKVTLGIQDTSTRTLGKSSIGYLDSLASGKVNNSVDGNSTDAQKIVSEAIKQVTSLRGRLGTFQKNTVGATMRGLSISVENVAAAQSVIRDADFATETANLTRSQILVQATTNALSLANQSPQAALSLLG